MAGDDRWRMTVTANVRCFLLAAGVILVTALRSSAVHETLVRLFVLNGHVMAAVGQAVSAMSVREQQARDPTPMRDGGGGGGGDERQQARDPTRFEDALGIGGVKKMGRAIACVALVRCMQTCLEVASHA